MAQVNATITVDLAPTATQWQAAKTAIAALRAAVDAVQQSLGGITVAGTATGGSVAFTVSAAQTLAALATLHDGAAAVLAGIEATQAALQNPPISVAVS